MSRHISNLPVTETQRVELQRIIARPTSSQRLVRRCRIIIQRHGGAPQHQASQTLEINRPVVSHWENRYQWKAEEAAILEKIQRARAAVDKAGNNV